MAGSHTTGWGECGPGGKEYRGRARGGRGWVKARPSLSGDCNAPHVANLSGGQCAGTSGEPSGVGTVWACGGGGGWYELVREGVGVEGAVEVLVRSRGYAGVRD